MARISGVFNAMAGATNRKDGPHEAFAKLRDEMATRAKKDDNDIVARFLAAVGHYYDGDLEQAITAMGAVAPRAPSEARVYIYMGMAHFWLGHQDKAEALIERAVAIGPSDPDVYYCRSQIARRHNLPLAVADLERYLTMTTRPWSIGPPKKDARVKAELDLMKAGRIPPDWDKPGPDRAPFEPKKQRGEPASPSAKRGSPLPGS